ncbi:MAG: galactokinase family protein, partial [Bacteroidota bacterium]
MKQAIQIQTPGRVCLFGDHQDYLGLPVIACAINRFVIISAETNATDNFIIEMPDIGEQRIIPVTPQTEALEPGDHWASVLKVVRRYGCAPNKGYTLQVRSTVPINAGVSSSSAVVVAWTQFLLETFGCEHPISQDLIARIAYEAEVVEHNSPGGNMDQYSVSVGGVLHIQTGDEFSFEKLHTELPNLVLGVSGIPKQTIGLLGDLRGKATTAISAIKKSDPSFNLTTAVVTDLPALYPMVEASLHP